MSYRSRNQPVAVVDIGTGFTKMGFNNPYTDSPNFVPQIVMPTRMSVKEDRHIRNTHHPLNDLDFHTGYEADRELYRTVKPMNQGEVNDWDLYERYMEQIIFKYLRCEPEDHSFLLTEPPLNSPENREYTAEIMFESFNVPSLKIAVQAVLAMFAGNRIKEWKAGNITYTNNETYEDLTGTIVDSGHGVTHIIPIIDGYVAGSHIEEMKIAGSNIDNMVYTLLKNREKNNLPSGDKDAISSKIKENYCYLTNDVAKEFQKYSNNPDKYIKQYKYRVVLDRCA